MDDALCNDTLDKIAGVSSFIELEHLYRSWIEEGTIDARSLFLPVGYSSLITHPAIVLHDGIAGIKSAEECQKIMMDYAKEALNRLYNDEEKGKIATSLLIIPPRKALLLACKTFSQLEKLLRIDTEGLSDEEIGNINGDDYAKVWINLAKKGLSDGDNLDEIPSQMGGSAYIIRKMHLSEQMQESMDDKHAEEYINSFFRGAKSSGCFSIIALLLVLTVFSVLL